MTNWLRTIRWPDRQTVFGLLGLWSLYLVPAALIGLASGEAWSFFIVGFAIPAVLVVVFAFAALLVGIFLLGVIAAGRVGSWLYHRFLWDRFRFHHGALARSKLVQKAEDRRRTGWGFLADAASGFVLGLGFSGVIYVPFLGTGVLSGHLLTESPPWLSGLGVIALAMGMAGSILSLLLHLASDPLWEMTRQKAAKLPPPVDDEFF